MIDTLKRLEKQIDEFTRQYIIDVCERDNHVAQLQCVSRSWKSRCEELQMKNEDLSKEIARIREMIDSLSGQVIDLAEKNYHLKEENEKLKQELESIPYATADELAVDFDEKLKWRVTWMYDGEEIEVDYHKE